jgi:hypothetical protein
MCRGCPWPRVAARVDDHLPAGRVRRSVGRHADVADCARLQRFGLVVRSLKCYARPRRTRHRALIVQENTELREKALMVPRSLHH